MTISAALPILWLTLRQFSASRGTRVVALFALTPVVFGLIYALNPGASTGTSFLASTYLQLLAPTVVPLATLVLATGALGNEIADRTLPYLVLKPISRLRIVLEKFAGVVTVTATAFLAGTAATWGIIAATGDAGGGQGLLALVAGLLAGIVAYGAIFMLVSLIVPRALVVGIVYILLWESLLARFIPGIRLLSVRHFSQSIFVELFPDPAVTLAEANRASASLIVLTLISASALLLAAARLRRMNLD